MTTHGGGGGGGSGSGGSGDEGTGGVSKQLGRGSTDDSGFR